jgi:hypothetical protein
MTAYNGNSSNGSGADEVARPLGQGEYVVSERECLNSIARKTGFFWQTLWNHPENAELRRARKDHNILMPGDRVYIPELSIKEEARATEQRHRFVRKGMPSKIKVRLLDLDSPEPYANKRYILNVDGRLHEGTVDGDGYVELPIDPGAQSAVLTVGDGEAAEIFELNVSGLDPIESPRGAQQRLQNLGFLLAGSPQDEWDDESIEALKKFQAAYVIETDDERPSGVYDEKTQRKLRETHGC